MPTVDLLVFTNGVNLSPWIPYLDDFKQIEVGFGICAYPGQLEDESVQAFLNSGVASYNNTRLFMEQTLIDDTGSYDENNNFYGCSNSQLPCFQLKNYKLYICPFAAYMDNYRSSFGVEIPEDESDYIDIRTINLDKLIDFTFTPKHICKYCVPNGGGPWIWHKSELDKKEINIPFMDLYFSDYDRYLKILNNQDYFLKCINQDVSYLDFRYYSEEVEKLYKRFGYGKIDIIIPYYMVNDNVLKQLYTTLTEQTIIEDCICYFICSNNSPDEKTVIDFFKNTNLNCVFLKTFEAGGPGVARQVGIDHSFNPFILTLDVDDYFLKTTTLEEIYNLITSKQRDAIFYKMLRDDQDLSFLKTSEDLTLLDKKIYSKKDGIYRRQFLKQKKIRYSNLQIGEDYLFYHTIGMYGKRNPAIEESNYIGGIYSVKNNTSTILPLFNNRFNMMLAKLLSKCITLITCLKIKTLNNCGDQLLINEINEIITQINDDVKDSFFDNRYDDDINLMLFYVLYLTSILVKPYLQKYKIENKDNIIIQLINKQDFKAIYSDRGLLSSNEQILSYIYTISKKINNTALDYSISAFINLYQEEKND